ncbi:hypothetical protein [Lacticaseibacillus sharpeae]
MASAPRRSCSRSPPKCRQKKCARSCPSTELNTPASRFRARSPSG